MAKIKFGDPESIAYKQAKESEGMKAFYYHECNCDYCQQQAWECPYCDSDKEPHDYKDGLVECSKCGKIAFQDDWKEHQNRMIISNFEKKNEK